MSTQQTSTVKASEQQPLKVVHVDQNPEFAENLRRIKQPEPEEQEPDDYDRMDEMFLALNNALEAKEEELKEKEEELKKREEEAERKIRSFTAALGECAARELDNEKHEKVLNEREEDLNKREEDLKKKDKYHNKNIELSIQREYELNKDKARLDDKSEALLVREEELNEREEELRDREKELNITEAKLEDKEQELNLKEQELEEKERELNTQEDDSIGLHRELRNAMRENTELKQINEKFPWIFEQVPEESTMNQSYPIIQRLNDLGKGSIYTAARKILIAIQKNLRTLNYQAEYQPVKWACAAGFYMIQFPNGTMEQIIMALKDLVKELREIHNDELQKNLNDLEEKVIRKLETTE